MDCLELNIHQRILSDIANLKDTRDDLLFAKELIASKVETREDLEEQQASQIDEEELNGESRAFMPISTAHCNIAFGEMVINFPEDHIAQNIGTVVPVLVEMLSSVPLVDFDQSLSWQDWALPDQLVFSTVSALLRITSVHTEYSETAVNAIFAFIGRVIDNIQTANSVNILTQFCPALHGLYRAIISTIYPWSSRQWDQLSTHLATLVAPENLDRLNRLLVDIHHESEASPELIHFIQTFLARYILRGRPLSGYFLVCCIVEMQWTVLAQALVLPGAQNDNTQGEIVEADAANKAWLALMHNIALDTDITDEMTRETLRTTLRYSMQCFTDLLCQIEEMDSEPTLDTYAWETMSESLKLASVCSVALRELDESLYSRLTLLLSDQSPISENLVQEAALKATTVLVQSFPDIAGTMATHLRRFVTSPLPIFESEFASESRAPPPLAAAAKCLAICIELAPGDDLIMSNMYSLLNYIASASKEMHDSSGGNNLVGAGGDGSISGSTDTRLRGLSEEEVRLVGISTISVVTRLALEFKTEEVTRLTISMLLQRFRQAEPTLEAAIAYNLVDLALAAPEASFVDTIRAFSAINRYANRDDPRFSNNMVLAAQTRLAQELHKKPEYYDLYLVELLRLFADKGVAIQNAAVADHHQKIDDMVEQLASLLLPIDALLANADYNPQINASPEIASLFRNMWFLCVLFHFTIDEQKEDRALEWQRPALARIAAKTPPLVVEAAHDFIANELDYNTVIRHEYAHSIAPKHSHVLIKHISTRADARSLSPGQVLFLLAMQDVESMRSAAGLPSSLASYFTNANINKHDALSLCMDSVAEKVIRGSVTGLTTRVSQQDLPETLSAELRTLLICSTHRVAKARDMAERYLNRLITSFPSLMCDPPLVFAILEVLTLLRRACDNEFLDEDNPVYEFYSERTDITLELTDSYAVRKQILGQLQRNANNWFQLALARAPIELQSTLQKYLAVNHSVSGVDTSELGASIAEKFGKAVGPIYRHITSLSTLSGWEPDRAKILASQLASKGYFAGEAAGLRLASREAQDKLDKLPPQRISTTEIVALKNKLANTEEDIVNKRSSLTVQDLKRLLFRCAATLISLEKCDYDLLHYLVALPCGVFTPSALAAGIEVWTWAIAETPDIEVALLTELLSAWFDTVRRHKGIFSKTLNYDDPFYHPVDYSPTDKDDIDRAAASAQRLLSPHTLILQMLFSRMQAARYRKPAAMFLIQRLILRSARAHKTFSTHPLAREVRFLFLVFGFETLKSSRLDLYCESAAKESLYELAYSWFAVRPQWSYGSNRVQVDADVKVLSEFLSYLQDDSVRSATTVSSLSQAQTRPAYYAQQLKNVNQPLRLLVENEIFRLAVWGNPSNEARRGGDHVGSSERTMLDSSWANLVRTVWKIDPAIAIFLTERFKSATISAEVGKMVRSSTLDVIEVPEALRFLIGDRLDTHVRRDLKHLLLWAPVPPVIAVTFFEPRYNNEPSILQYAHRVLEQHPVNLTFFFVPQVVQALRHDDLGYVERFIFETAKISQHFCHQIIWNMKANCYKDDAAEVEDPMKPSLDRMTDMVVSSLSGEARDFYDREFGFFHEVTSISGKLKPYIKRTKPEKKAKIDEEMAKIVVDVGVYLPSNPEGQVVDIDKKSGRPLQSHAKAPFMATFKVRRERVVVATDPDSIQVNEGAMEVRTEYDVWQQAIFKVGDDCRQDVLALQIIAMFKNIFTSIGLTLYLYPYRVTATAPGCGVIDVVPNATSRDEMGRAKVNDLLDFFVAKYGGQDTIPFQKARLNFIQSMAAYSVACYILQIKDRHNGNIMIDGEGHIVHIDFGFLFDIDEYFLSLPGVKFEPNSFKLNHEMVTLMGGRPSQGYDLFQHLTVKAFLAIRPYADQLVSTVELMLGTGLPSFKGEPTIKRLRDRFALGLNERQAAEFMMGIVKNAHENVRSTAYDEFQRLQNGIPYK
ncbi:hypothetical protein HWV62_39641 [Athelia sp. TMB]|nr:hypothetical protein HWV62_39641 [Athelia sp. TMB]